MTHRTSTTAPCGCYLAYIVFALSLGAFCFDYILYSVFGKDVPWYADMIAGLVMSSITVPLAVVCWIVRLCGIDAPFVS